MAVKLQSGVVETIEIECNSTRGIIERFGGCSAMHVVFSFKLLCTLLLAFPLNFKLHISAFFQVVMLGCLDMYAVFITA